MAEEVVAKLNGGVKSINETKITFQGTLIPETENDFNKLVYLCYKFREAVKYAVPRLHKGVEISYKDLTSMLPNTKILRRCYQGC